jgi:hypothetical protein
MIKLHNLLNEETFTATNKASGKTSVFKSKASKDAAIKAGTHSEKGDTKSTKSGGTTSKVNIFDKPAKSEPKSNTPKLSPKMIKMDLDDMKGTLSMSVAYAIKRGDRNPNVAFGLGDNQYDNILKRLAKIGGASEHDMKFRTDNYSTAELEKWAKERLDLVLADEPKEEPKTDEPKSEPKKKRPGNPSVNKDAKKLAEKSGITPQKLGNEKYKEAMFQAAVSALTDSNFHSEARELVAAIEGKPEFAKRPEYPSIKDPKYKEKMADIRKNSADGSIYMNGTGEIDDYGTDVSQASGWDGVDAADGIAFTLRMNGFHKEADLIQSVFDNKPYMKNEGRISLSKMVNESEAEEIANLTGLRTQAVKKFIEDNNIDDRKLLAYLKLKGPKTLSNRMDISTAIVGKPGNKYSQGIIKAFSK